MRCVAIADLHCGSAVAVTTPENFGAPSSVNYGVRRALYGAYEEAAKGAWHKPDVLIVNGDAVDGQGVKSKGVEQWTTDPLVQISEAARLINMWNARRVYILRGSNYHVDASGIPLEELLGKECGAEKVGGETSGWDLTLRIEDVTFHCAHHLGYTRVWQYRSTAITRDMLLARLNDMFRKDTDKHKQAKVLLRAHVHYWWHIEADWQHGFIVPSWQAKSPFMARLGSHGMTPSIGFVGFTINGEEFSYEKHLWPIEQVQPARAAIVGFGVPTRETARRDRGGAGRKTKVRANRRAVGVGW